MSKTTRIQFELSEDKLKELEALMETSGIRTKKELFNSALTLFGWALYERKAGRVIASMDEEEGKYKELLMPALGSMPLVGSSSK